MASLVDALVPGDCVIRGSSGGWAIGDLERLRVVTPDSAVARVGVILLVTRLQQQLQPPCDIAVGGPWMVAFAPWTALPLSSLLVLPWQYSRMIRSRFK